nr:Uncharacterised protein [Klebsiella pneumoniae]
MGEKHQRRRQAAFLFMKMVLGNPCAVEAQTLRVADLFGRQPVARLRGALIEQTGKKPRRFGIMRSPCGPVLSGRKHGNGGDQFAGVGLLRGGEQAVYVAMLHHRPARSTVTLSAIRLTVARSWVMNR